MIRTAPRRAMAQVYGLATRLPWWGGLLSALAAYVLLHPISALQMPMPIGILDVVAVALGQIFIFLASIGQYLLPLAFLVAAAVSGFHHWKRDDLRVSVAQDGVIEASDAALTAGRQLAALIRAEGRVEEEIELSVPRRAARHKVDLRTSQWRLPRIRAAKIADAVGILATLGVLWGTYEWFLKLPDSSEDTPWVLLGADGDAEALRRRLQGFGRDGSAAKLLEGKRPLGQYRFGPPPGFLTETAQEIPSRVEEPVEVYHSLRELETAFDAKYVPPPECYTYESNNLMVRCANHRIRARQAFIDSGGKVTATLLGSWEEPRRVVREAPVQAWSQYDQGDWQQQSAGAGGQEWRQDGGADLSQGQYGEHRLEPHRGEQRSEDTREPIPIFPQNGLVQGRRWDWQRGYGRDSESDWMPVLPGQPGFEPQSGWRREWTQEPAREPESDRQRGRTRQPDPQPDWQEDRPAAGEDDWGRAWWSEPLPVERRHWVDDL